MRAARWVVIGSLVGALAGCGSRGGGASPGAGPAGDGPASRSPGWPKRFRGRVLSVAAGPDGRVFVVSDDVTAPLVVSAYDARGALLWERRWTGPRLRPVGERGLAAAPDGGVFVAFGAACDPGAFGTCEYPLDLGGTVVPHGAVVRLTGDGRVAWWREFQGFETEGIALAAAPDGRVAARGYGTLTVFAPDGAVQLTLRESLRFDPAFDADGALCVVRFLAPDGPRLQKLDRSGAPLWDVGTDGFDAPLATAADGAVAVLGSKGVEVRGGADGRLLATVKSPVCCSLSFDREGAVVLAGRDTSGAIAVVRHARSGAILADRLLGPLLAGQTVTAVALRADGAILVAGESDADGAAPGPPELGPGVGFVLALGPTLDPGFGATGPTPPPAAARWVASGPAGTIAPDGEGGAFVSAGLATPELSLELRRVRADGTVSWTRRFGGFYERSAAGLAATPDGGVVVGIRYVCGISKAVCDDFHPDLGGGPIARDAVAKLGPDGAFEWQVEAAALDDGTVVVGPGGELAAIAAGALTVRGPDGALRWTSGAPGPLDDGGVSGVPALDAAGRAYVARLEASAGARFRLTAWDADGSLRWAGPVLDGYAAFPTYDQGTVRVVVLADGTVLAAWPRDTTVALVAADAETGTERWRASVDLATFGRPPQVMAPRDGGAIVTGQTRDGCHEAAAVRIDATGRAGAIRSLSTHGACVGAPFMTAAALAADGALLFSGLTVDAADLGGIVVAPGTPFLASAPAP